MLSPSARPDGPAARRGVRRPAPSRSRTRVRKGEIDALLEKAEPLRIPFDDPGARPGALRRPVAVDVRPGRNDPCPCGSGKKCEKCHLQADERDPH